MGRFTLSTAVFVAALALLIIPSSGLLAEGILPVAETTSGTAAWLWLVVPGVIGLLLVIGYLASIAAKAMRARADDAAASAAEHDFNMRVARVMDTVGSVANGIAATLLQHPPAPADVIAAVRGAAISQGVQYVQQHHPEDLDVINLAAETLATRLDNTVSGKLLTGSLPLPNAVAAEPSALRVEVAAAAG